MSLLPLPLKSLTTQLGQILSARQDIILAYLYGSAVHGSWTSRSDIDIGLYLSEKGLQNPWFPIEVQEELKAKISSNLVFDVRILNGAAPRFLYEVIFRTPKLVVRDESTRIDFECKALIEWYDIRVTIEAFRAERMEALRR